MRISDWSSDVCSSDLTPGRIRGDDGAAHGGSLDQAARHPFAIKGWHHHNMGTGQRRRHVLGIPPVLHQAILHPGRSEEHTSELQSLMRISYAVFCLKKKKPKTTKLTKQQKTTT